MASLREPVYVASAESSENTTCCARVDVWPQLTLQQTCSDQRESKCGKIRRCLLGTLSSRIANLGLALCLQNTCLKTKRCL